jgi:uncharacterized protein (TIGR00251 family)
MPLKVHWKGLTVNVHLVPGSRVPGVGGVVDAGDGKKALKVSVRSPPEGGEANKELLLMLAKEWNVPKSSVSLLSGDASRSKVVLVAGDGNELLQTMTIWLSSLA